MFHYTHHVPDSPIAYLITLDSNYNAISSIKFWVSSGEVIEEVFYE